MSADRLRAFADLPVGAAEPVEVIERRAAARRRTRRRRVGALSALVLVVAGAGAVRLATDDAGSETVAAESGTTSSSVEPTTTSGPTACDPPPFAPVRLPWSDEVGPPTELIADEGTGYLQVWQEPGGGSYPGGSYPRALYLSRGGSRTDMAADPAGTIRGNQATAIFVGDPGVGLVEVYWSEGSTTCDQYAASMVAFTADEIVTLFEP